MLTKFSSYVYGRSDSDGHVSAAQGSTLNQVQMFLQVPSHSTLAILLYCLTLLLWLRLVVHRESAMAEMGIAISHAGETVGVKQPTKVHGLIN